MNGNIRGPAHHRLQLVAREQREQGDGNYAGDAFPYCSYRLQRVKLQRGERERGGKREREGDRKRERERKGGGRTGGWELHRRYLPLLQLPPVKGYASDRERDKERER